METGGKLMKKWTFWAAMCLASLLHGGVFYLVSLRAMQQGIAGADNQAALLFIPLLWIAAGAVLLLLNVCTLICGRKVRRGRRIYLTEIFQISGLPGTEKRSRILSLVAAGVLMAFAYNLFAREPLSAAAYALTGGLLLAFLFAWRQAARG